MHYFVIIIENLFKHHGWFTGYGGALCQACI